MTKQTPAFSCEQFESEDKGGGGGLEGGEELESRERREGVDKIQGWRAGEEEGRRTRELAGRAGRQEGGVWRSWGL